MLTAYGVPCCDRERGDQGSALTGSSSLAFRLGGCQGSATTGGLFSHGSKTG